MEIIIGTANFSNDYAGVKLGTQTIDEIVRYAVKNGIDTFDTANSYGNSERSLSVYKNIKIITKGDNIDQFKESMFRTGLIHGYLIHHLHLFEPETWGKLLEYKEQGFIKQLGFSVYTEEEIYTALEFKPDIIQLPINLQTPELLSMLEIIKGAGAEVHARSVLGRGELINNGYKLSDLLDFIFDEMLIDKVVLGVNSVYQLQEILRVRGGKHGK